MHIYRDTNLMCALDLLHSTLATLMTCSSHRVKYCDKHIIDGRVKYPCYDGEVLEAREVRESVKWLFVDMVNAFKCRLPDRKRTEPSERLETLLYVWIVHLTVSWREQPLCLIISSPLSLLVLGSRNLPQDHS